MGDPLSPMALGVRVRGLDPVVGPNAPGLVPGLILAPDAASLAEGADALVLVTEWPVFRWSPDRGIDQLCNLAMSVTVE